MQALRHPESAFSGHAGAGKMPDFSTVPPAVYTQSGFTVIFLQHLAAAGILETNEKL